MKWRGTYPKQLIWNIHKSSPFLTGPCKHLSFHSVFTNLSRAPTGAPQAGTGGLYCPCRWRSQIHINQRAATQPPDPGPFSPASLKVNTQPAVRQSVCVKGTSTFPPKVRLNIFGVGVLERWGRWWAPSWNAALFSPLLQGLLPRHFFTSRENWLLTPV